MIKVIFKYALIISKRMQ